MFSCKSCMHIITLIWYYAHTANCKENSTWGLSLCLNSSLEDITGHDSGACKGFSCSYCFSHDLPVQTTVFATILCINKSVISKRALGLQRFDQVLLHVQFPLQLLFSRVVCSRIIRFYHFSQSPCLRKAFYTSGTSC